MSFTSIAILIFICILVYYFYKWNRGTFIQDFHSKTVFITGTDSGFGRKLALDLDAQGLTIYAGCYTDPGAEDLRKCASKKMRVLKLDVTKRNSIIQAKELVEKDLLAHNQALWAVVNNAGINKGALFEFCTMQDYRDVMAVNFFGGVEVIEIFLPLIKKSRGRIVNVISIAGRCSTMAGPYSASKFAFEAYTDGLRRAMRHFFVKVSIIEPGVFKTQILNPKVWRDDLHRQWAELPTDTKEQYGENFFKSVEAAIEVFCDGGGLPFFKWNTLDMVTGSITHAIGAKHPKDRYLVGYDAKFIYRLLSFLPDVIQDAIFYIATWKLYNTMAIKFFKYSQTSFINFQGNQEK